MESNTTSACGSCSDNNILAAMDNFLMPPPPRENRKRSRCNAIGSFDELGLSSSSSSTSNTWTKCWKLDEKKEDPDTMAMAPSKTDSDSKDHSKRYCQTELQGGEETYLCQLSTDERNKKELDTTHESHATRHDALDMTIFLEEDRPKTLFVNQYSTLLSQHESSSYSFSSSSDPNDECNSRQMDSSHLIESSKENIDYIYDVKNYTESRTDNQNGSISQPPSSQTPVDFLDRGITTETIDSIIEEHSPGGTPDSHLDYGPSVMDTSTSLFHTTSSSRTYKAPSESDSNTNRTKYDEPSIKARFSDIVGHGSAKIRLDEMLLPLALPPSLSKRILTGVRAIPASILFYGPPGCGKTQLARAVAGEAQAAFLSIGPSDILSKFVGESEASVRDLFQHAKHLASRMESKCCVIFFDEIDALGVSRGGGGDYGRNDGGFAGSGGGNENSSRRLLAELLIQLTNLENDARYSCERDIYDDGDDDALDLCDESHMLKGSNRDNYHEQQHNFSGNITPDSSENSFQNRSCMKCKRGTLNDDNFKPDCYDENDNIPRRVIVIAATNRPEDCDPALLRRFAIRVLVGLPTERDRQIIISRLLKNIPHSLTADDLKELAAKTEGWSGSDLESVSREAVMVPIREVLRKAAVLKSSSGRMTWNSMDDLYEKGYRDEEYQKAARDTLLKGFHQLRPVCLKDFDDAISFWMGVGQDDVSSLRRIDHKRSFYYENDYTQNDFEFEN